MTIKRKLFFAFGLLVILFVCTIILNQIVSKEAENRYEVIRTQIQPAIKSIDKFIQINNSLKQKLDLKLNFKSSNNITLNNKLKSITEVEIPNLKNSFSKILTETDDLKIIDNINLVLSSVTILNKRTTKIISLLKNKKSYSDSLTYTKAKKIHTIDITMLSAQIRRSLYHLKIRYNESNLESQNDLKNSFSQISAIILIFGSVGILLGIVIAIRTIKSIIEPIDKLKNSASIVGSGNYNHQIKLLGQDELTELGKSFNLMTSSLKNSFEIIESQKEKQEKVNLLKTNKNNLYESLKGELSVKQISNKILLFFLEYYKSPMGAFHVITERDTLKCEAIFASDKQKELIPETVIGTGILGEAVLQKKPIIIEDVPEEYAKIKTTLGELKAQCIYIFPIIHGNDSIGVLELACLNKPTESEISFMTEVNDTLGISINAAQGLKYLEKAHNRLERSSEELNQKNKELEQFVYITSHDLQEPLRTISSYADILEEDFEKEIGEEGMQYVGFLQKASKRLTTQIHSLLELSRIGSVKQKTKIDFNTIFSSLKNELSALTKEKNGEIIFPSFVSETIQGSEIELQLLFQNLIVNAFKYNKSEKPLAEISYMDNGDSLTFCVTDNGVGIDEKHHEKIFQIFQRLDNGEGSGIGLAHCKKIVELHNGKIWIDSEKGKGSSFFFDLKTS